MLPLMLTLLGLLAYVVRGDLDCRVSNDLDTDDRCTCFGDDFTLNLRVAFESKTFYNLTASSDRYVDPGSSVVISPCVDYDCGGRPSRGCMWDPVTEEFIVLGVANGVLWDLNSVTSFKVEFRYGDYPVLDTDHGRTVSVIARTSPGEPTVTYVGTGGASDNYDDVIYQFEVTAPSFLTANPGPSSPIYITLIVVLVVGVILLCLMLCAMCLLCSRG